MMNALGKGFFYALQKMLPEDFQRYPESSFVDLAEHAAMLRETKPWCQKYTKEIFLQYVVNPRVNDEDLSFCHKDFYDAILPHIQDLSTKDLIQFVQDAAQKVNVWCAGYARYAPTDERTASPRTVFQSGFGRCGELSTFVVSALRSVGIAARQVYVPKWSHTDDNHAWVEFLAGESWHYFGACEPRPQIDNGWFNGIASQAVLVRSKAFGKVSSRLHGELLYQEGNISYFNQISRYCPEATDRSIRVMRGNRPVSGAKVHLQVLNEGAFCTIASLTADDLGLASFCTGAGTVRYTASEGGLEATVDSKGSEDILLQLHPPLSQNSEWSSVREFDPAPMTTEPEQYRLDDDLRWLAETREETTLSYNVRLAELNDPSQDGDMPERCRDLLDAAMGNRRELITFLRGDRPDLRERLLRTLPEKDLRDTPSAVLESHFAALPPQGDLPDEIYWPYLACPRLHLEKLIPWRDPDAAKNGMAFLSSDAQAVAQLRLQGIPARLRPLDGLLERWENGSFRLEQPASAGTLTLEANAPVPDNLWSITKVEKDGSCRRLDPAEYPWTGGRRTIPLLTGRYHLVSAVRTGDGSLFFQERELFLPPNQAVRYLLMMIRLDSCFMVRHVEMPAIWGQEESIDDKYSLFGANEPTLLLWFQHRDEPAVHLLEDLKRQGRNLTDTFGTIFVMLDKTDPDYSVLRGEINAALPTAEFLQTSFDFYGEQVARLMNLVPGTYPMLVVGDGCGSALFAQAGYAVGTLETMFPQVLDYIQNFGWNPPPHLNKYGLPYDVGESEMDMTSNNPWYSLADSYGKLVNWQEFLGIIEEYWGPYPGEDEDDTLRRLLRIYNQRHPNRDLDFNAQWEEVKAAFAWDGHKDEEDEDEDEDAEDGEEADEDAEDEEDYEALLKAFEDIYRRTGPDENPIMGMLRSMVAMSDGDEEEDADDEMAEEEDEEDEDRSPLLYPFRSLFDSLFDIPDDEEDQEESADEDNLPPIIDFRRYLNPDPEDGSDEP